MNVTLCFIFFLSGSSALIFETLWFRQASLSFGNSVWASSLVLTAFMAGLALGNGAAARYGSRVRNSVAAYALLEVIIGIASLALVWVLPGLAPALASALRPVLDEPWLLNAARLLIAFVLLLVPCTAMGATLPLLVRALSAWDSHFGRVLGRLYGWNTLGAVLGAVASEVVLMEWLGVRGSGFVAAAFNGVAAIVAGALAARAAPSIAAPPPPLPEVRLSAPARWVLLAAFLSGFALLALEVVWFRFLLLFLGGTSLAFALMLAVVLIGIALGGLCAGQWLRRDPQATRHLASLAWASGILCALVYVTFSLALDWSSPRYVRHWSEVLFLGTWLMFPVSFFSGIFFPTAGAAIQRELATEVRAAGLLTLANTTGAALGSLAAGFLMLPSLGMERSFFLLAALYGLIGLVVVRQTAAARHSGKSVWASAAILLLALVFFPWGLMEKDYLERPVRKFTNSGERVVAVREGLTETIQYLRVDRFGEPYAYRLVTNGYSMAGTSHRSRRYMKLYVYWPVAVHADPKRALLISYGVGVTAKALTDTSALETIDIVDISKDVLEMGEVVYPNPTGFPLNDPRVRVHIEDGRYFLQTTDQRFDLITAEPPPPKVAGVVNLYTREYFQLIHDSLAEGGIATYWLPIHSLSEGDTRAIVRAFCDAIDDCSLWLGTSLDWMLVGTRGVRAPIPEERFERQWRVAHVREELEELGLETPAQLGALFLADAAQLDALTQGAQPLVDNWPKRLRGHSGGRGSGLKPMHREWMDPHAARDRFRDSKFIRGLWPPELREQSLRDFEYQHIINELLLRQKSSKEPVLPVLHRVLQETSLVTLPMWLMNIGTGEHRIAARLAARHVRGPRIHHSLGAGALARRDFETAERYFALALERKPDLTPTAHLYAYTLCREGRRQEAAALADETLRNRRLSSLDREEWLWLAETCKPVGGEVGRDGLIPRLAAPLAPSEGSPSSTTR